MENIKLNSEQICSINIYVNCYNSRFTYFDEVKRHWPRKNKPSGWYSILYGDYECYNTEEELLKEGIYYVEDKKLMYYPHIVFTMSNNKTHNKYFKTEDELNAFLNTEPMCSIKFIE